MNIYNRLNDDLKEEIDKRLWDKHKKNIKPSYFICRDLRMNILNKFSVNQNENVICYSEFEILKYTHLVNFLTHKVFPKRLLAQGYCGAETGGEYKYIIDEKNKKPLLLFINTWNKYLQNKSKKPNFEDLYENIRLAIDDWCCEYICCVEQFILWTTKLDFVITDIYDYYIITYGGESINELVNSNHYYATLLTAYLCEMTENLIVKSFDYIIDSDDEDEFIQFDLF